MVFPVGPTSRRNAIRPDQRPLRGWSRIGRPEERVGYADEGLGQDGRGRGPAPETPARMNESVALVPAPSIDG